MEESWSERILKIREEVAVGGAESPCPFCELPRCRRSDYLRCSRCGINWLVGENTSKDPRTERQRKMLDESAVLTATKTKNEKSDKKA